MARKFLITCGGCGAETGGAAAAAGPLRVEVTLPLLGWATFSVEVTHGGARALDLCGGCKRAVCGRARLPAADAEKEGAWMADGRVSMRCGGCGSRDVTVEFDCRWDQALQAWVPVEPDPVEPDPVEPDPVEGLICWCEACESLGDLRAEPLGDGGDEALEGSVR